MKIETKFILSSVLSVGCILTSFGGVTLWGQQREKEAEALDEVSDEALEITIEAKFQIRDEISILKNYVLLGNNPNDFI